MSASCASVKPRWPTGGGLGNARNVVIAGTVVLIASRISDGMPAAFSMPPRGGEPWQPSQNVS